MPEPIFVAASDLHGEYCAYAAYPQMWGDSYFAFEQIVDKALELDVPLVLAGDLFDKPYPDPYTLRRFFAQTARMAASGNNVFFTQGQHELNRRQPWMSLAPWSEHLHGQTAVVGGYRLFGLDWQPADKLKEALQSPSVASADVLVCHQVWSEFMGSQTAPEGSIAEQVPSSVRLVVTGDFHAHTSKSLSHADGRTTVVLSPGSTTLQAVGEDPAKYFYVVYDDLSFRSVPLQGRRVVYSRAFSAEQLLEQTDAAVAERAAAVSSGFDTHLPVNLRMPMWVVQYHHEIPNATSLLKTAARDRFHLFLRPFGREASETESKDEAPEGASGLAEALSVLVPRDSRVYSTALRLLTASDPKAELGAVVGELVAAEMQPEDTSAPEEDVFKPPTEEPPVEDFTVAVEASDED